MMTDAEVDRKIQEMITSGNYTDIEIINFVKNDCQGNNLRPQTLGMLFEMYAGVTYDEDDELSGFSKEIPIDVLSNIHHCFVSTNGCQWARSDNSYLGKKYIIKRGHNKGKVSSVKLDGLNMKSIKKNRGIRADIRKKLEKEPCRILDVHSRVEIDHKDAHYDVLSNQDTSTQKESDFQPLSKAANDAKRQHCLECIESGKRYDARRLGYKEGFIAGDEDTPVCAGCYWYDPQRFNAMISKNFIK